jgi:hypothetical protein
LTGATPVKGFLSNQRGGKNPRVSPGKKTFFLGKIPLREGSGKNYLSRVIEITGMVCKTNLA